MKSKTTISLLAVFFVAAVAVSCTQQLSSGARGSDKAVLDKQQSKRDPLLANEVNANVLRSFYSEYGEITGANWFRSANGYAVSFKQGDMSHTVYYRLNGVMDAKLISYPGDRLPAPVRDIVRSGYFAYSITHVTEVHKNNATAFYVKLEDVSTIKMLKIVDGESELVENLQKR
jgi:hypothetical protein